MFYPQVPKVIVITLFCILFFPNKFCYSEEIANDLLLLTNKFVYKGAFRLPLGKFGDSTIAYSPGTFTINNDETAFFIAGHRRDKGIAELTIPTVLDRKEINDLNFATVKQPFVNFLDKKIKNPQNINLITGMEIIKNELFVNAIDYYDAPADNTHTTFIVNSPESLKTSKLRGFYELQGAAHAAGWMTPIPKNLKHKLNGAYIVGSANNFPINSRLSIGPSAFSTYLNDLAGIDLSLGLIPAKPLIDFTLKEPLHKDTYNLSRNNNLWTELSTAAYGFIIPNTNLYFVLGHFGGLMSGGGYKITQSNGNRCGGPCAYNPQDYYNYYWIFDVEDMIKVNNGLKKNSDVRPIDFGVINLPFEKTKNFNPIIGADFVLNTSHLYILIRDADNIQNRFEPAHLMLVYQLK